MAEFNPTPQPQGVPNYTGASQGIHASPNTALGTLFSSLADTLSTSVKAADEAVQEKIRQDVYDETDEIQNEFGVGDATLFQQDTDRLDRPAQLESAGRNLDRLQSAYQKGALKESHYWARLNSMVRQLRAKYPGYRPEIDQMVSSVVGARPANALRNALFDEWAASTNGTSPLAKLEDWAIKNGDLPVDYYQRSDAGNPYTQEELGNHVATKERDKADTAARQAQLALQSSQNTLTERDATNAFRLEANQTVEGILGDVNSTVGKNWAEFKGKLKQAQEAAAAGHPLDQTQVEALRNQAGELRQGIQTALQQKYYESWDGNPNHSYAAVIGKDARDDAINSALQIVDIQTNALNSENPYSVLKATGAYLDARKVDTNRQILDQIPVLQTLQSLQDTAGPDVAGLYLSLSPDLQNSLTETFLDYAKAHAVTDSNASVSEDITRGQSANQGPEYYQGLIEHWQKMADQVSKGEIPLDMIQKNVQYMFGSKNYGILAAMDDNSKFEYFRKVASPQVTAQMLKLKKMGDADSWETYQQWVVNGFMGLFRQSISDINSVNTTGSLLGTGGTPINQLINNARITWDPNSKTFRYKVGAFMGLGGTAEGSFSPEQGIRNINTAIQAVAPIIEENGGDVSDEISQLFQQMGFNPDAQTDRGILGSMAQAVGGFLAEKNTEALKEEGRGSSQAE